MGDANRNPSQKIFISHAHEERLIAERIRNRFSVVCQNLDVFISEDIPAGERWEAEIRRALQQSDGLMLICTGRPTTDWCLFEAGYFAALAEGEGRDQLKPLFCLCHKDASAPDPLKGWQSVVVDPTNPSLINDYLERFFSTPLRTGAEALHPALAKNRTELEHIGKEIINAFGESELIDGPNRIYHNNYLILSLEPPQVQRLQDTKLLPDDTMVEQSNALSLKMFRLTERSSKYTWAELFRGLSGPEQYNEWKNSIGEIAWYASYNRIYPTSIPLFESQEDSSHRKFYRPVFYCDDSFPNGKRHFHFLFIEMPSEDEGRADGNFAALSYLLDLRRVLLWGVLKKYLPIVRHLRDSSPSEDEIKERLGHLGAAIRKIESEEERLNLINPEQVADAFSQPEDREKVAELTATWHILRRQLRARINLNNMEGIPEILDNIRGISKDLMALAAKEYHKSLNENELRM